MKRKAKRLSSAQVADLDETRRLLYMALVVRRTEKYELAGTLINALKHHQGVDVEPNARTGVASDALVNRVVAYLNGDRQQDDWLITQIAKLAGWCRHVTDWRRAVIFIAPDGRIYCRACWFAVTNNEPRYHEQCDTPTRCSCDHRSNRPGATE